MSKLTYFSLLLWAAYGAQTRLQEHEQGLAVMSSEDVALCNEDCARIQELIRRESQRRLEAMPYDRESNEEYDDGYTRESFERADEDREMEPEEIYEECHRQGEEAAYRGAAVEDNPYDANKLPLQHHAWRDGVVDFHDPTGRVR